MKPFMMALCSLFIMACQCAAGVHESSPDADALRENRRLSFSLMEKCGLYEQIENVPDKTVEEVRDCFKRNEPILGKMPDHVVDEINRIIRDSFKPKTIRSILADYISSRLSHDDIESVIAWLDSPLGRKITRIEEMASTPEAYREMAAIIPSLKLAADYDERLELVHEIDNSVKATELIMDRMLNMQIITLTAMASAFPAMNLPSEEQIRTNFQKNKPGIAQAVSREIALSILYTYRDISKDDIRAYIQFMKTDYGKRYHQVVQDGTNKAYTYCGKAFSESVVKRIREKSGSVGYAEPDANAQYPQER
jgi:uncharacterized protein YeeX (DUF496 family)